MGDINLESRFNFIVLVCSAITDREYEDALRLYKKGIQDLSKNPEKVKLDELLKSLEFLADFLEFTAGEDFGVKLRRRAIPRKITEPECSFCGKRKPEVNVLVAGYGAFICDNCTEVCSKIVASEVKGDSI